MRSDTQRAAATMSSFMIFAACRLTSGPPQSSLGQVSETTPQSTPCSFHGPDAQAVIEHRRHGRHERRAVEVDGAQAAATSFTV